MLNLNNLWRLYGCNYHTVIARYRPPGLRVSLSCMIIYSEIILLKPAYKIRENVAFEVVLVVLLQKRIFKHPPFPSSIATRSLLVVNFSLFEGIRRECYFLRRGYLLDPLLKRSQYYLMLQDIPFALSKTIAREL